MSTIILILGGLIALVALLIVIGYLLERYGIVAKVKEIFARLQGNFPTYRRWLITGGITLLLLVGLILILIIIF